MKYCSFGAFKGSGLYKKCLVLFASLTILQVILVGWGIKEYPYLWNIIFEEDRAYEMLTAFLYAAAAALLFVSRRKDSKSRRHSFFLLAFAVLFIFIAMEEISWGQRIMAKETPEWFSQINQQGETNVHNLHTDIFHVLLWGGSIILGVVGPLLHKAYKPIRRLVERTDFPIMSPDFHFFFLFPLTYYMGHNNIAPKLAAYIVGCIVLFIFFWTPKAKEYVSELPLRWGKYLVLLLPALSLFLFHIHRYLIPINDNKAGQEAAEMLLAIVYFIFAWSELRKATERRKTHTTAYGTRGEGARNEHWRNAETYRRKVWR